MKRAGLVAVLAITFMLGCEQGEYAVVEESR